MTATPEVPASAAQLDLTAAYAALVLIREFEDEVQRQFLRGHVHGTTHLCTGQEAVAVGVAAALGPKDLVAATYRGHGHALARGVSPYGIAAELMGRSDGICGGRAGSMNLIDNDHGLLGCFGIVGGSIAAATGAALALRGSERVAVAFFGEGAANQAYFAESLNLASVLRLPVVFCCENNLYGEYTPWKQVTGGGDIPARVRTVGLPATSVDGNDVSQVYSAAREAVAHARTAGPSFTEYMTYRQVGHSRSDPGAYRPAGELDEWIARDPLRLARNALASQGPMNESELDALADSIKSEVEQCFRQALDSPAPTRDVDATEYCDA